jgi:hypothetical protein
MLLRCKTIAQLTDPPPDPYLDLWLAVIRRAEQDARHPYATRCQIEARRWLAELRQEARELKAVRR